MLIDWSNIQRIDSRAHSFLRHYESPIIVLFYSQNTSYLKEDINKLKYQAELINFVNY